MERRTQSQFIEVGGEVDDHFATLTHKNILQAVLYNWR